VAVDEEVVKELFKRCDLEVGVTPHELYMRQNGLCWLEFDSGAAVCTDGFEASPLASLLNPTLECAQCAARFIHGRAILDEDSEAKQ